MSYWKTIIVAGIALVLVVGVLLVSGVLADGPEILEYEQEVAPHAEPIDPSVVLETPDTVPHPDSALTAAALGVSIAEVISALAAQDAFDDYVDRVSEQFPGQISGTWMDSPDSSKGLNTRGNIRFKGEVPAGIRTMENVRLIGSGGLSRDEHHQRTNEMSNVLDKLGYKNYLMGYSHVSNKIEIQIQIPEAESANVPRIADLLTAFNQHLMGVSELRGTAAGTLLTADDIQLDIIIKDGPIFSFHHSRGGNWLWKDSQRKATSGWSVDGPNGDGIVTVAHGGGNELNKFEEPGLAPYSMTYRSHVLGLSGDATYYTTSHVELAEFYASNTSKRPARYRKPTSKMVGNHICFYGRMSNKRVCGIEVAYIDQTGRVGGVKVGNLVKTASDPGSVSGDSGGPWFSGYTAYGINVGGNGSIAVFMPIEEIEDALDVTLKTK